MRARAALVLVAACGRVGFDPASHGASDARQVASDAATVPPGPALWLEMNTPPLSGIIDGAGSHTTTCMGGSCPALVAGHRGGGFAFAMEELVVTYAPDLDAQQGYTAALWVNLPALPANTSCVFALPFDNAAGFDTVTICIDPDGTVIFDSESPSGVANALRSPSMAVTAGAWHHLAQTWDGTTKRGYVDGIELVRRAVAIGHSTVNATVGATRGGLFVNGTLDDVIYYTRALSAAEVALLASP